MAGELMDEGSLGGTRVERESAERAAADRSAVLWLALAGVLELVWIGALAYGAFRAVVALGHALV